MGWSRIHHAHIRVDLVSDFFLPLFMGGVGPVHADKQVPEKDIRSSGGGVTGSFEALGMSADSRTQVL